MATSSWSFRTRALFLVLVVFWGFNYVFVNVGLGFAGPLWLATLRAGAGAIATLLIVSGFRGWGTLDRAGKRDALLLGLPNTAVFFGLWFWAARDVLPGIAAVVVYTFPLWVAMLSQPVLGHRLGARHWVSVAFGFVGVALISQVGEAGNAGVSVAAILVLLVAALAWALGTVLFQRRFRREQMMEANAYQLIGGSTALLAATLLLTPTPLPGASPDLVLTVLWLGVLGTGVAYAIWFSLLGQTRAATLSAYVFLVPVVALAASAIFFGERLSVLQLGGVGLVLVSIYGIGRAQEASVPPAQRAGP
ncbi:MAG: EamA family transporter [Thermoplasmata archaeon]